VNKEKQSKIEYQIIKPPIVTMLGHVNHGKTSLLDAIRDTRIQTTEAGGITQSVRAHLFSYKTKKGEVYNITFIDTPGHEAFSKMRSRGASVTDIAILVVACDDGVQPQTIEAIEYAKNADVPIIVALNKIDIKGVDKNKVLRELSNHGVLVEKLGGDVMCIETSAKKKKGIEELIQAILLTAEINKIRIEKCEKGIAKAIVLESTTDKSLGPISLCLIKSGKITVGNFAFYNNQYTKLRGIKDEYFKPLESAEISEPVWLIGFKEETPVGEILYFSKNINEINIIKTKAKKELAIDKKTPEIELDSKLLKELLKAQQSKDQTELNVILKSESAGTLEVAVKELEKLSNKEINIKIIEKFTGDITKDDIIKAQTNNGIVLGFRSHISNDIAKIARIEKVLVNNYEIIYELLEEVAEVIEGMKKPKEIQIEVARAKVKKVFILTDNSKVMGCKVLKGTIVKGYQCFIERPSLKKDKVIGEAKIISLKYLKEEIHEAPKGSECGILFEPELDIQKDDEIVCFKIEKA